MLRSGACVTCLACSKQWHQHSRQCLDRRAAAVMPAATGTQSTHKPRSHAADEQKVQLDWLDPHVLMFAHSALTDVLPRDHTRVQSRIVAHSSTGLHHGNDLLRWHQDSAHAALIFCSRMPRVTFAAGKAPGSTHWLTSMRRKSNTRQASSVLPPVPSACRLAGCGAGPAWPS